MMSSLISSITALFKPRMMDREYAVQGFDLALNGSAKYEVEVFLYFFLGAALQAKSDPFAALDRLVVDEIIHQQIEEPQHDFLTIHTIDSADGSKKKFVLERMIAGERRNTPPHSLNTNTDNDESDDVTHIPLTSKLYDSIKKFVDTIFALLSSEPASAESRLEFEQLAMEEGSSSSFSPTASVASESLSMTDSITVSASEAADSVSDAVADSLDQTRTLALDRFLGDSYAQLPRWSGIKLRGFKPNCLKFFEFVILALVVHRRFPHYSKLGKNCIFYASLMYASAERYGGNANSCSENNHPNVGCWKGLKVTKIDSALVSDVVKRFKRVLARQISTVSL
jgi:hypothetical protein